MSDNAIEVRDLTKAFREVVADIFNRWKSTLPPKPGAV
jgi:hypothetical protein